jgi:hypothetical protein
MFDQRDVSLKSRHEESFFSLFLQCIVSIELFHDISVNLSHQQAKDDGLRERFVSVVFVEFGDELRGGY